MNKQNLEKYAELKNSIKVLEESIDELQPLIMAEMEAEKADEVDTDFGKFLVGKRRTYTYPAEIESEIEKIKELKKEAEAKGTANYVEKPYLIFKDIKK